MPKAHASTAPLYVSRETYRGGNLVEFQLALDLFSEARS